MTDEITLMIAAQPSRTELLDASLFALAFFAGTLVVVPVALVTRLLRARRGRASPP